MLVLPLKPAVRFDLQNALALWLDNSDQQVTFEPANPLQFVVPKPEFSAFFCRDDLVRLQSLRNCVADALLKSGSHKSALEENALADCHEYHAALLQFEKQGFPTLDDDHNGVVLTWKGAFASTQQEKHGTLIWDRAVIMFNIAALETSVAAECSPTDRAACKKAVGHCQTAAGLLGILRQLVESQDFATVDLSNSMLIFWEKLSIAVAQTNIYRMAALAGDSAKHTTLAYLSKSAYNLFNEALTAAQEPRLLSEVPKQAEEWGAYCKAQSMLAAGKATYHCAVTNRLAHEHGKEIARLAECATKLESLQAFCKTLDSDGVTSYARRECAAYLPLVKDRLDQAERDNHNIYQEKVPLSVPDIEAKQLARAVVGLPSTMMVPSKALFVNL
jgi:hypothetical protein